MATLSNKKNFPQLMHIKDILHLQETDFFKLNFFCKGGNAIHHQRLNTWNMFFGNDSLWKSH